MNIHVDRVRVVQLWDRMLKDVRPIADVHAAFLSAVNSGSALPGIRELNEKHALGKDGHVNFEKLVDILWDDQWVQDTYTYDRLQAALVDHADRNGRGVRGLLLRGGTGITSRVLVGADLWTNPALSNYRRRGANSRLAWCVCWVVVLCEKVRALGAGARRCRAGSPGGQHRGSPQHPCRYCPGSSGRDCREVHGGLNSEGGKGPVGGCRECRGLGSRQAVQRSSDQEVDRWPWVRPGPEGRAQEVGSSRRARVGSRLNANGGQGAGSRARLSSPRCWSLGNIGRGRWWQQLGESQALPNHFRTVADRMSN